MSYSDIIKKSVLEGFSYADLYCFALTAARDYSKTTIFSHQTIFRNCLPLQGI